MSSEILFPTFRFVSEIRDFFNFDTLVLIFEILISSVQVLFLIFELLSLCFEIPVTEYDIQCLIFEV